MKKLFLISSSYYKKGSFLEHCFVPLSKFMGVPEEGRNRILFIPYARADRNYDGYTKQVAEPFIKLGYEVVGAHSYPNFRDCLSDMSICTVYVGGGNTWLLKNFLDINFLVGIKNRVENGIWKYVSASAGTVMAGSSMLTTNDMAPVIPRDSNGFGIVPFQVNPHFIPGSLMKNHRGETREERLKQVILHNPEWQIVGLPEGCWIEKTTDEYILRGTSEIKAAIFRKDGNNSIWLKGEPYNSIGMM